MESQKNRDFVEGLAERLKSVRLEKGLSQVNAGELSGVGQIRISSYETGRKTPTLRMLLRLSRAYGVRICDLIPADDGSQLEPSPTTESKPTKKTSPRTKRKAAR